MSQHNVPSKIKSILIVGGGTAGWMAAAALSHALKGTDCKIQLIESDAIGTVGVGEATIPGILLFNKLLGINEDDFMRATHATFKLGIEFVNWGALGDSYIHPFSSYGKDVNNIAFHHYWLKFFNQGIVPHIEEFSLAGQLARQGKFARIQPQVDAPFQDLVYAFQFDAGLYANYLREYAEQRGVERLEGTIKSVQLASESGEIASVQVETGAVIGADFFLDCSGFRSLLLGDALEVGFEDWSHWLPCDRAWAVGCENIEPVLPYTRATAHASGWQWRIPLQHRTGNGHVFSSQFISEDEAADTLLKNLPGAALGTPKLLKFNTGRRTVFWEKNCIALGLASGFMEPLESTSIHLVQEGITKLLALFPNGVDDTENRRVYNQRTTYEYERIRDFIILHYKATTRSDSAFWRYCAAMDVPEFLANKISLYQSTGHLFREDNELFSQPSWLAVMHGQGVRAKAYHPLVNGVPEDQVQALLAEVHFGIRQMVKAMPAHHLYIEKFCAAK